MNVVADLPAPIGFARHAGACLAAAAVGSTAYVMVVLAQIAWAGHAGAGLVLLPFLWIWAFLIALCVGGFWLTLVWPVLRRPGAGGLVIAPLAVAAGAIVLDGGLAVALGRTVGVADLATFAVLGGVTGLGYWRIARRR